MTPDPAPHATVVGPVGGTPGRSTLLRVQLRNDATLPRTLVVTALGLDSEWLPAPVRTAPVEPGGTVEVELALTPSAGAPPGAYSFVVVVQAVDPVTGHAAGPVTHVESALVVGDPSQLAIEIEPTDPRAVVGKRVGVHLTNRGTRPLSVELATTTASGLAFRLRRKQLDLAPGATIEVRGRLSVDRHRWVGQSRRMPFVLTARGETTPVRVDGVFVAHPILNRGITRAIALIAVLAVWCTAGLVAVNAISKHARSSQAELTAISGSGGGGGGGDGQGGGGKGGQGAGKGGGKGTAGASPAERLNGTVKGPAPGGVTVSLSETSLTKQQPPRTSFVNAAYTPGEVGKLSSATTDLAQPHAAAAVRRTTTAKDGSFAFAGVKSPGYYLVTLTKPGYQSRSMIVSATPGKPLPTVDVTMAAGDGQLSGAVTDARGDPLPAGARVTITGGTLTLATTARSTGKNRGHWQVDGLSTPGDYVVSAAADGYGTESKVVHVGASGQVTRNLTLRRGVESIEGLITFGANQPLGGATITATDGTIVRKATSLTKGSAGFYSIADLPTGVDYTVTVAAPGFATQTFRVHLDGSKSAARQDATLTSATATITGSVFDQKTNDPIDSAGLILAGDTTYKIVSRAGTGEFTFDGVVPGDYTLTAEAFGYVADFRSVTVHAGDVVPLDPIGLTPDLSGGVPATSTITGHVVDAHTGAALQCPTAGGTGCRISVTIRPPQGQPALVPISVGADQPYTVPSPSETDPTYAKGLPPGLYTLTFKFPGYEPNTLAVAVPESTAVSAVPVALVPNGTILGHITATTNTLAGCVIAIPFDPTASGTPVALPAGTTCGTQPSAAAIADGTIPCAVDPGVCIGQIDGNGDYEIKFVPHGTYWVYIRTEIKGDPAHTPDPQFVPLQPVQLTVEAGQSRRYDAILNQFGKVKILLQVAQPSGEPGTLGAGHTVYLWNSETHVMLPSAVTDGDGVALFPTVPSGTYLACAYDPETTPITVSSCPIMAPPPGATAGVTDPFQVSVNQTINVPLVLTKDTGAFIGRVLSLVDNTEHVVPGTHVQISGVVGYSGQVARRDTATATTDSNGCFAMGPAGSVIGTTPECPTAPPLTAITFKTAPDAATIDSTSDVGYDRYGIQRLSGLTFVTGGTTNSLVVKAPTTPIKSNVTLHPSENGASPSQVSVLATQLAPGAGSVTLSVDYSGTPTPDTDATGTLVWQDASLDSAARNDNEAVPGTYVVRASRDGYDNAEGTFHVPLIVDSTLLSAYGGPDLDLNAHGALEFDAVDPSNAEVLGATYTLSSSSIAPVTVTAAPDAGSVTFPSLSAAAGPYTVTIRAAGYAPTTSGAVNVDPGATLVTTVPLSPLAALSGTVRGNLGDGHTFPLAGAKVTATDGTDTFHTTTDVDGTYSLTGTASKPGLRDGAWDVTFSAFGYTDDDSHTSAGGTPLSIDNATSHSYTVDGILVAERIGHVRVEVRDDAGLHVDDAHVALENSSLATPPLPCDTVGGVCTFDSVAPLTYAVTITKSGYAPLSTSMTVRVGDPATQQEFVFVIVARGNTVNGTVTGRQVDGSTQSDWTGTDLTTKLIGPTPSTTDWSGTLTLATGEFSFIGLPDGTFTLTVTATGYQTYTQKVTVSGGQAAFINVTLNAQSFQLKVNVASAISSLSMSGYTVALHATTGGSDQAAQSVVLVGGKYSTTFNQVEPGEYDVIVTPPTGQIGDTVSADYTSATTAQTLDVVIHEALLHVTVTSAHGAATTAPTATLTVTNSTTSTVVYTGTVSADGSTTDIFVPTTTSGSTDYSVSASLPSGTTGWVSTTDSDSVSVADGATQSVTLSFTEAASLTVNVTLNSDGSVVDGAVVTTDVVGVTCTTNSTGSCTLTNLDTTHRYEVTATKAGTPNLTATAHNVRVDPGPNSVNIAIK